MFKISGKQAFGAVWKDGKCIASFQKGIATTNDPEAAKALAEMGYTVSGEADAPAAETTAPVEPEAPVEPVSGEADAEEKPKRSSRKKTE